VYGVDQGGAAAEVVVDRVGDHLPDLRLRSQAARPVETATNPRIISRMRKGGIGSWLTGSGVAKFRNTAGGCSSTIPAVVGTADSPVGTISSSSGGVAVGSGVLVGKEVFVGRGVSVGWGAIARGISVGNGSGVAVSVDPLPFLPWVASMGWVGVIGEVPLTVIRSEGGG
jgi:hypothetical protein